MGIHDVSVVAGGAIIGDGTVSDIIHLKETAETSESKPKIETNRAQTN